MRWRNLHPLTAVLYYAGLVVFIFLLANPFYILLSLAGLLCMAFMYAGGRAAARSLRFIVPLALLMGLLNPLFVRRGATILFYMLGNPVTLEACAYGAYSACVMTCALLLFVSFNRVVDDAAFLYLTARIAPRTAMVINLGLNALGRFRAMEYLRIQETKGVSIRGGGLKKRLNTALALFKAFTVRGLEEGMETAEALKARDYGAARRTAYRSYRFKRGDALLILVQAALGGAAVFCFILGNAAYVFYPALDSPALTPAGALGLAAFALYVFTPLFYELPLILTGNAHGYNI